VIHRAGTGFPKGGAGDGAGADGSPENRRDTRRRFAISRRSLAPLAMAVLLPGCASVPVIGELRRHRQAAPPSSPPADEAYPGGELQKQFDLQRALSSSPIVSGNTIKLLDGGMPTFRAMFQAMRSARDSINLEYFIIDNVVCDGVFLGDVLLNRLADGVRVNISYDAFGSRGTPAAFFDHLRRAGAKVNVFNPLDPLQPG
jgi:cardiolipin synthase